MSQVKFSGQKSDDDRRNIVHIFIVPNYFIWLRCICYLALFLYI